MTRYRVSGITTTEFDVVVVADSVSHAIHLVRTESCLSDECVISEDTIVSDVEELGSDY